jgi:hypothetical protein
VLQFTHSYFCIKNNYGEKGIYTTFDGNSPKNNFAREVHVDCENVYLLNIPCLKFWKFMTYSYNVQVMHAEMCWGPFLKF